ncbi:MAG: hydrogenase expression/formation protein HypE [Promethearchaeota archaeon]
MGNKTNEKDDKVDDSLKEESELNKVVLLAHGAGGKMQEELIKFITKGASIRQVKDGVSLDEFDDGATIPLENMDLEVVMTADGHTVDPLFFPGGDLGKLSATGTINDLLMMGANPVAISSTVFIEEGMDFKTLERIFDSFYKTLSEANVALLCGDTKVLPKGNLDKIIMATTGIGLRPRSRNIQDNNVQVGDDIIITGSIGDHGSTLMALRNGINLDTELQSDVGLLLPVFKSIKNFHAIHAMKDPTRGGLASALNDWAIKSHIGIMLNEESIPIKREVRAISDILGLDPMQISCEGRAVISTDPKYTEDIIKWIRSTEIGAGATVIGKVTSSNKGRVLVKTRYGGTRIVEMPLGEPIPRVC